MDTTDLPGAFLRKMELMATNPARALLEDIEMTRRGAKEHNATCTVCETPKKKVRAAYAEAYNDVCNVMIESIDRQVQDACAVLEGRFATTQDGKTLARAAAAATQNTLLILLRLTARIHDPDPKFEAFDALTDAMSRLADAIDAANAKAKGLN